MFKFNLGNHNNKYLRSPPPFAWIIPLFSLTDCPLFSLTNLPSIAGFSVRSKELRKLALDHAHSWKVDIRIPRRFFSSRYPFTRSTENDDFSWLESRGSKINLKWTLSLILTGLTEPYFLVTIFWVFWLHVFIRCFCINSERQWRLVSIASLKWKKIYHILGHNHHFFRFYSDTSLCHS